LTPIQLWQLKGSFLIIPGPSGIVYSNQAGGMACLHPKQEGALVPFPRLDKFLFPCWGCWGEAITIAEADEMDAFFKDSAPELSVDRTRLADSTEAWVWVVCRNTPEDPSLALFGSWSGSAILTWENCD
jgi:hypothetical protein